MPELPEVETIKHGLEKVILHETITKIWVEKSFTKKISPNSTKFRSALRGAKIVRISRRAKLLILALNTKNFVLIHLKLTGQLIFGKAEGLPSKFARAIFYFKDKSALYFNDIRKFGYLKLVDAARLEKELVVYGAEPLSKDFTIDYFCKKLAKHPKFSIKQLLMDQAVIAGLGNIYSDEVCFVSGVRPNRRVGSLSRDEKRILHRRIKNVLTKAIKHRGTSVDTYVDSSGRGGNFQNYLFVYGRSGEKCKKCGAKIQKMKIGGRTSCYCQYCQR